MVSTRNRRARVTVLGGMNMDIHAVSNSPRYHRGTSNPAGIHLAPGGVGRNIAGNLAVLGIPTRLLSAVGDDTLGTQVLAADMTIMDQLNEEWIRHNEDVLRDSSLIVADANLPAATLQCIVDVAAESGVPVLLEPVSAPKAARIAAIEGGVYRVTPDAAEYKVLSGSSSLSPAHTVVTLGGAGARWIDHSSGRERTIAAGAVSVVDATGAGDAFTAGLVAGLSTGRSFATALSLATVTATTVVGIPGCTISSEDGARISNQFEGDQDE